MTARRRPCVRVGLAAAALLGCPPAAHSAGDVRPGAYCPFPKAGEKPSCMAPARQEYGEFFAALDDGELSESDVARLERDVASGPDASAPYLAISSLSYGYFRLAQQAAATPGEDPTVVARLERWNQLLADAYDISDSDPEYRAAVREAAEDLQERAPGVTLECVDASGETVECRSTEVVLRGFNRAGDEVGIRGALRRLLHRVMGGDDE